jgi:hypothetical protein
MCGRGMRYVKPTKVIKKPEEMMGKGKKEFKQITLKVETPKKFVSFS